MSDEPNHLHGSTTCHQHHPCIKQDCNLYPKVCHVTHLVAVLPYSALQLSFSPFGSRGRESGEGGW